MEKPITTFKGNSHEYTEIASRDKHTIGLHTEYKNHPETGIGHLVVRFALITNGVKGNLEHFKRRATASFHSKTKDGMKSKAGFRLNRVAIPVFSANVYPFNFGGRGDEFKIWPVIAGWVNDQVSSEPGFTQIYSTEELAEIIRSEYAKAQSEEVELLLEFPSVSEEEDETPVPTPKDEEEVDPEKGHTHSDGYGSDSGEDDSYEDS